MKLGNLNFRSFVFGQSGIQGFYGHGDEYRHHKWYKIFLGHVGFSFKGMSFVAKTVTLEDRPYPQKSNTELVDGYKIKDFSPASIWWSVRSFIEGYLLNAIGLANQGLSEHLRLRKWQRRRDVFQVSIMLMKESLEDRLAEAEEICALFKLYMPPNYMHHYAFQINDSCPNTGHEQSRKESDIIQLLGVFRKYFPDVVLILKFDFLVAPETVSRLQPYCDAFCMGNTVPYEKKEELIPWSDYFGQSGSPLAKQLRREMEKKFAGTSLYHERRFAGGLSGAPLFPVLVDWLERMQACDPKVGIIAGGGIMTKADIDRLAQFPMVKGIALGSVAILRPWRMRSLIRYGNEIFALKSIIALL